MVVFDDELFPKLPDDLALWRYMGIDKLLSLIDKSSLYFCRADRLPDQHEGKLANSVVSHLKEKAGEHPLVESLLRQLFDLYESQRAKYFVSCWHASEVDSNLMWKAYGNTGLAIKTRYATLINAINSPVTIRANKIKYCDYDNELYDHASCFNLIMHKRTYFADEREFRLIAWSGEEANQTHIEAGCEGFYAPVDTKALIEEVWVSPFCESWMIELLGSILEKYGIPIAVKKSYI